MTQSTFVDSDLQIIRRICGVNDRNIKKIESILNVTVVLRGGDLLIKSDDQSLIEKALNLFNYMAELLRIKDLDYEFDDFDVKYMAKSAEKGMELSTKNIEQSKIRIAENGKIIVPRTENQAKYMTAMKNLPITFGTGPAGTGKTYLAVVTALDLLLRGNVEKIILTRPAVEAGENLGFLPGDLMEKVNPYLRPLYDALIETLGQDRISKLMESGIIEVAPLAYMRGRTLNNAFIILDEAQNTSIAQMKMFLTRMGKNSKIVVSGDETQIDLPKHVHSGLIHAMRILSNVKEMSIVQFTRADISRHPIVEKIVKAYLKSGYMD